MELKRSCHYDGFDINSERDIKSVFPIGSQFTDHNEKSGFQRNFGKLAIKFKLGLRLSLFFTSRTQNIWCVTHSVICVLGYSRKIQTRVQDILLEFFTFLLYLWKFQIKQSSAPRYSTEMCQIPWKLPGQKLNRPLEFPRYFFLVTLQKFNFVFN